MQNLTYHYCTEYVLNIAGTDKSPKRFMVASIIQEYYFCIRKNSFNYRTYALGSFFVSKNILCSLTIDIDDEFTRGMFLEHKLKNSVIFCGFVYYFLTFTSPPQFFEENKIGNGNKNYTILL